MLKNIHFVSQIIRRHSACSSNLLWNVPNIPQLDLEYLCNDNNIEEISRNINSRKGVGDINLVLKLKKSLAETSPCDNNYTKIQSDFYNELLKIPNRTHDAASKLQDSHIVNTIGEKSAFNFKPKEFYEICKRLNLVRTDQLGNVAGNRSYYVLGELAELEQALINYTIESLLKHNFELVCVPDILHRNIIEACGLNTRGDRTQVYTLSEKCGPDLCLSGTSEMALASLYIDQILSDTELPIKLVATSRCYRAETSSLIEERGIFRVHQFTKVEMFAISKPEQSDAILEDFRIIEEEHFSSLGLHLQTLDMPPHELGAPAYRKYDIEAWLPGRNLFGEISSCSDCTDYQSRRLNIRYKEDNNLKYVHTLNGTACAIPRMLIAIIESFQTDKGVIEIPKVLQKYMNGKTFIGRQKKVPALKLIKYKK